MKTIIISILLLLLIIPLAGNSRSFLVGAFDPPMWHGVVMVRGDDVFAFRFAIHKGDQKADGYDTFYLVERVGPITAGGKYSEVAFNTALPFGKKGDTPIGEKNAVQTNFSQSATPAQTMVSSAAWLSHLASRSRSYFIIPGKGIVNISSTTTWSSQPGIIHSFLKPII